MCARVGITHLAYVDDLILFARMDESTITLIANCITEFESIMRLQPNLKILACTLQELMNV